MKYPKRPNSAYRNRLCAQNMHNPELLHQQRTCMLALMKRRLCGEAEFNLPRHLAVLNAEVNRRGLAAGTPTTTTKEST